MDVKEAARQYCWDYLTQKRTILQERRAALQESLQMETKSSAGDKHETGRAMVQLEQEKLAKQLLELDNMARVLDQVGIDSNSKKVGLGNLVRTNTAIYFIAISAGAVEIENTETVFCVSARSPIAQAMLGKEEGFEFVFNGAKQRVLEVV